MPRRPANPNVQTSTTWVDAGYDCDHCGGRILRRTDHETGLRDRTCFQCEQCSCQWTLERQPLRVGTTAACRAAQRKRAVEADAARPVALSRWLLVVLVALALLGLVRFGGGAALRVVLPLALAALLVLGVLYYVRRHDLW